MKKILYLLLSVFMFAVNVNAQTNGANEKPQMADLLRSDGKIYVVVGVLLIIFIGTVMYLISIDRKVARLEKQTGQK